MPGTPDWKQIHQDPRFALLHARKVRFLWGLMLFSVLYYFLLPIGAGYFPQLFATRVWGPVNVGLVFAFSQFVIAWGIAYVYSRRASREFDQLAAELASHYAKDVA